MLGQQIGRLEGARGVEGPLRDDAGAFAEQVRRDALEVRRNGRLAVGDVEMDRDAVAGALQAALDHHAAQPDRLARLDALGLHVIGRVEISRLVLKRGRGQRSEEHTSELQSLMRISYAVFCLKKKQTYK